jgi:hypothetical protein
MTGKMTHDGVSRSMLTEGSLRKGGNNATTQIQTRPPAPAAMRPSSGGHSASNGGASASNSSPKK